MLVQRRNKSVEKCTLSKIYLQESQNSKLEFRGIAKIEDVRKAYSNSNYILVIKVVDFNIHTGFEREVYIYPSVLTIN
jgi:hypothetical protein